MSSLDGEATMVSDSDDDTVESTDEIHADDVSSELESPSVDESIANRADHRILGN